MVLIGLTSATASSAQEAPPPAPPPVLDDQELLRKYVWSTLGPSGALHATLASGFEQWRGAPDVWRTDASGYTKRWLSEFAESAIGNTTKYAVARILHHDPSFARCACTGVIPRLRHAVASPFLARTRDGRTVWSPATVAGLAAENVIPASTWYPAPNGTRDGVRHAASGVAAKVGVDVFREFVSFRPFHRTPRKP
jgi:hypothetical protein